MSLYMFTTTFKTFSLRYLPLFIDFSKAVAIDGWGKLYNFQFYVLKTPITKEV